jgi:hypothetical protein
VVVDISTTHCRNYAAARFPSSRHGGPAVNCGSAGRSNASSRSGARDLVSGIRLSESLEALSATLESRGI